MTTIFRLVAGFTTLFLAHTTALAEPPIAPPPHLALDEVVKEYRRLGLPIPSPKAELVRVTRIYTQETHTYLALRHPSTIPGKLPQYQTNTGSLWALKPDREVIVQPIPASLEGAPPWDGICFVAQCKLRGWDELAAAAYAEWMKPDEQAPSKTPNAIAAIRLTAWYYWESQLAERYSDRKEAFTQMSAIAKWDPSLVTWRKQTLLPDLKKTIAPRKSKPGSIEAIIDDLTEDWTHDDWENEVGQTAYWKLIELGFDAVPALMAHIEDTRLMRSRTALVDPFSDVMRVNDRVEYILDKLSGERFSAEHRWATSDEWKPPKEHTWWAKAQKLGEEKWLLDNVLPKDREQEPFPNHIILRVIRAKYPSRLKDVYQTLLDKHSSVYGEQIVQAILKSKLTQKEKITILEQGAKSNIHLHRYDALEGLAVLDLRAFQTHLLQFIKGLPQDLEFRPNSYNDELTVLSLIRKTDDRNCWLTLTDLSHRVSPTTRLRFIRIVSWPPEAMEPNPNRECIRYLLDFANDAARGTDGWTECPVIRDYATIRLASLLGLVELESQNRLRSPREISILRDRVRELTERKLARPIK